MAGVAFEDVRKAFGTFVALQSFDLKVEDGEFMSLLGPSGCGKTTALRMLAGLEQPTAGTIRIGDRIVNGVPPAKRDIAMVFQSYALYPHMTVAQNIAYPLRKRGVPRAERPPKVKRAAELLQLEELLGRKPRQLSGGQQQRVALGRCIVRHPQVFLFDEPLSNLDAKLRANMRIELKHLRERVPTTSIYVTHDQVEAMTLGDRVVVMLDGWIQQVGTPLEIYNEPRNLFVAGFMGSPPMNFIEVGLSEANGWLYAEADNFRIRIPDARDAALRPHAAGKVTLGIRPEHVVLGEPAPEHETGFDGGIDVTEQLGSEMQVGIEAAGTAVMISRIDPQIGLKLHEKVRLSLKPDHLHFFDRNSEEAIV